MFAPGPTRWQHAKVVGGVFVVSVVALLLISGQGEVNLGAPWQFPILSQKSEETNDLERWMAMNGDSPDDFERWMKLTHPVVDADEPELPTVQKSVADLARYVHFHNLFEGEQMHRNRGGRIRRGCVHTNISTVLCLSGMHPSLGDCVWHLVQCTHCTVGKRTIGSPTNGGRVQGASKHTKVGNRGKR